MNDEEAIKRTIAKLESIVHDDSKTEEHKDAVISKFLDTFCNDLSEEEQEFILRIYLQQLSYREIVRHPDHLLMTSNMKMRTIFFKFVGYGILILLAGVIFGDNSIAHAIREVVNGVLFIFNIK